MLKLDHFPGRCRLWLSLGLGLALTGALQAPAGAANGCAQAASDPSTLGVGRVVEIDTSKGPVIGNFTKLHREANFLASDEVVLTFDDGPMPWITRSILATLERHCTRATFFSVGKMAVAYPSVLREVLDHGHTVGSHTWSHPLNLKRLKPDAALSEIERGFAAVATAAGRPIAPFFRFPGLSDSPGMVADLAERHIASFTVDVVSNDSFINDPARLARETLAKIEANHGGIVLFHDIKASTAKALPVILDELAKRGYSVVHLVPKAPLEPRRDLMASFEPQVAKLLADKARSREAMVPFFGAVGPERVQRPPQARATITTNALSPETPEPVATLRVKEATGEDTVLEDMSSNTGPDLGAPLRQRREKTPVGGWSTTVRTAPR